VKGWIIFKKELQWILQLAVDLSLLPLQKNLGKLRKTGCGIHSLFFFISSFLLSLPQLLHDLYKNRNSGKQYVPGSSFRNWCKPPGWEIPAHHGRGGDRGDLLTIYVSVEGAFLTPLNDSD
jgi:hypothetical protein